MTETMKLTEYLSELGIHYDDLKTEPSGKIYISMETIDEKTGRFEKIETNIPEELQTPENQKFVRVLLQEKSKIKEENYNDCPKCGTKHSQMFDCCDEDEILQELDYN